MSLALAAARGVYYVAVMLLFGSATFGALLRTRAPVLSVRIRSSALTIAMLAACAWLVLVTAQMTDGHLDAASLEQVLSGTLFGQMFVLRVIALAALIFIRANKTAAALSGLALALPAITSHAAASSPANFTAIGATLDAIHLLCAGFWIGGLAMLANMLRHTETDKRATLLLFSESAMIAVALLVMTGLINAASIILGDKGAPSPLYLGVLGIKLVLVALMLGLALVNRFRLTPQGRFDAVARNVALELALGVAVTALAGVLGQIAPTL
jgi:putative copper resistance protein D